MAKFAELDNGTGVPGYIFHCPGCDDNHQIKTPPWEFDGNLDAPTVGGSVLVQGGRDHHVCHSFINQGNIQFLSDCTHDLRDQTVELPEWPY